MKRSNILAHRGFWKDVMDQNTSGALNKALSLGFGIETDLRDKASELVVSHDPPKIDHTFCFKELLDMIIKSNCSSRIALNIKSDGLQAMLEELFESTNCDKKNCFAFDMSVPDSIGYSKMNFPHYIRSSEYETSLSQLNLATGVWIDNFTGDYSQINKAIEILKVGKRVALVSPELHGRDYIHLWNKIKHNNLNMNPNFELCTDYPEEAYNFFVR